MNESRFNTCFEFTLGQEGGYSDDPNDPGNWTGGVIGKGSLAGTCWGISAPLMIDWLGRHNSFLVTPEYMKSITVATARMIYKIRFWTPLQCDRLATGVDLSVWDFGVNAGVPESAKILQRAVHVPDDGIVGPVTLAAAGTWVPAVLIRDLTALHDQFYREVNNPEDLNGWLNRQDRILTTALSMAGNSQEVKS